MLAQNLYTHFITARCVSAEYKRRVRDTVRMIRRLLAQIVAQKLAVA